MREKIKKFIKTYCPPVYWAVRLYRWMQRMPIILSGTLYKYHRRRFLAYAGAFNSNSKDALLAKIIMGYHVLEKGMTMPGRREMFGKDATLSLISLIDEYEAKYGIDDMQVKHAVGCLKEYESLIKTQDATFIAKVSSFLKRHSKIEMAAQLKIDRTEFFAKNNSDFYEFAHSRHTCRYYDGPVDMDVIRKSVELAMTAPSACNRQYVRVHCVSNHTLRDAVLSLQNGNRGFGDKADKLLVITSDLSGLRWAEERNDIFTNAGIFIMNLSYALHYYELASCILNWSVQPKSDVKVRKLLSLKGSEEIVALIACGNPPAELMIASSPRKGLSDVFAEHK